MEHHLGWITAQDANRPHGTDDPFDLLRTTLPWRHAERPMYDRVVAVPRLMSWHRLADRDTPELLRRWADRLDGLYGTSMTSAGLNLYRDGSDSVAFHGDVVGRHTSENTVAIVSLGAPRPMLVRPAAGGASRRWMLNHGDLFVMGGRSQREFQHAIPKVATAGPRISVVFRETTIESEPEYALDSTAQPPH